MFLKVGIEPKFNAESGNYMFANIFYGYVAYFAYLVQGLVLGTIKKP